MIFLIRDNGSGTERNGTGIVQRNSIGGLGAFFCLPFALYLRPVSTEKNILCLCILDSNNI